MLKTRIALLVWLSCAFVFSLIGQDTDIDRLNSPYSYYGMGELADPGLTLNRSLGGLGAGLRTPFNVNPINPASYSAISLTTLEFGFHFNNSSLNTASAEPHPAGDVNLSYLAIGLPLGGKFGKNWGMAAGIKPFSKISYNINETIDSELGIQDFLYTGDGDVYETFIGTSYEVGDSLWRVSAGFNANYTFGKADRATSMILSDAENFFPVSVVDGERYSGWNFQYGIQGSYLTKKGIRMTLGASGDLNRKVNVDRTETWRRIEPSLVGFVPIIIDESSSTGTLNMPSKFTLGFVIEKGTKWLVGADLVMQNWSDFNGTLRTDSELRDANTVIVGAAFTPDPLDYTNYWKNVNYRFGIHYSEGYLRVLDTNLPNYGVSFGIGLPVRRNSARIPNYSRLNLSFDIGQRGTTDNSLIRVNYFKTTIGLTMNDRWFIPQKFD